MAFLDKSGLQTLTNKLAQGDTIQVSSHRGNTVKNVVDNITRECDNVANPLEYKMENRVTEFKIGKGRDADVSGDVEKGYSEIEFQGKTWQNLFNGKPVNSVINSTTHSGYIPTNFDLANKIYTYIFTVNNLDSTGAYYFIRGQGRQTPFGEYGRKFITQKGRYTLKVDLTGKDCFQILCGFSGQGSGSISDVLLLEGDHTQTPIEELPQYFEGIKSSFEDGIVDIDVTGKNLFDEKILNTTNFAKTIYNGKECYITKGNYQATKDNIIVDDTMFIFKKNTQYSLSMIGAKGVNFHKFFVEYTDGSKVGSPIYKNSEFETYTINTLPDKTVKYIMTDTGSSVSNSYIKVGSICMMEGGTVQYEPHYKKKISFNIGEPLRSLPNGVCDEIRNNNSKRELIRRVGKRIKETIAIVDESYVDGAILDE